MTIRNHMVMAAAIVAALVASVTAGAAPVTAPKVTSAWARASSTSDGALYMTIAGRGRADRLLAVSVPASVASMAHLHRTTVGSDGMVAMLPVMSIPVPARGRVVLAPGGYHVMLMSLAKPLRVGRSFPVTLTFAKSGKVTVTARVRAR